MNDASAADAEGSAVPVFRIDLSLPPFERYVELAMRYRDQMRSLTGLFDELILSIHPSIPLGMVHWVARLCQRRLYADEETEELQGISQATGIEMYLLVSSNVVLDLLMGCTSGAVKVKQEQTKMLHFRTLDWGMDPLRKLVVQLEYVRSPEVNKVLGTSITYVGFIGILTGVRRGLSVSLNFRPVHDSRKNVRYYFNHLLILLGRRQSISSLLRQCILPTPCQRSKPISQLSRPEKLKEEHLAIWESIDDLVGRVAQMPTTAAYLTFSDGVTTFVVEKDYRSAVARSSSSFIAVTNHDQQPDSAFPKTVADQSRRRTGLGVMSSEVQTVADLIEESTERLGCMQAKWDRKVRQATRAKKPENSTMDGAGSRFDPAGRTRASVRLRRKIDQAEGVQESQRSEDEADGIFAKQSEVIHWLSEYPVLNETTHYAAIMDPSEGKVAWARRHLEPLFMDEI